MSLRPSYSHQPSSWPAIGRALLAGVTAAAVVEVGVVVLGLFVVGRRGGGPIQGWDHTVWSWFLHHRGGLIGVSKVVAVVFDAVALGPIALGLTLVLLALGQRMRALAPLVAYLGGEFFVFFTRVFVHRPRPISANYPAPFAIPGVHETSFSYPSGHSTAGSAVLISLGVLAIVTWRTWMPWLVAGLLALAGLGVACTRLILGVHWFSDVAFGAAAGLAWGILTVLILRDVPWPFAGGIRRRRA
ncbi:MAG TPA: phosphatase PAP2 family protein [Acidimicrobiales bacterium]|nr:phosphatase PAP2 family protein [Acidimicrobiales bacterium]